MNKIRLHLHLKSWCSLLLMSLAMALSSLAQAVTTDLPTSTTQPMFFITLQPKHSLGDSDSYVWTGIDYNNQSQTYFDDEVDVYAWNRQSARIPREKWKIYLESQETGEVSIRPYLAPNLCLDFITKLGKSRSGNYLGGELHYCNNKPSQRFFIIPAKDNAINSNLKDKSYTIRFKTAAKKCINVRNGEGGFPLIQVDCQKSTSLNDRWFIVTENVTKSTQPASSGNGYSSDDARTISFYADLATFYFKNISDSGTKDSGIDGASEVISTLSPIDQVYSDIPGSSAYASPLIPGQNINFLYNGTSQPTDFAESYSTTQLKSFTYGLTEGTSATYTHQWGVKDVASSTIALSVSFSANQTWQTQNSATNTATVTLHAEPKATVWMATGYTGKVYNSRFRVYDFLGDQWTSNYATANLSNYGLFGGIYSCSNYGVQDCNGKYTGAYQAGSACAVSWPSGIGAPTDWPSSIPHVSNPPANHIYNPASCVVETTEIVPNQSYTLALSSNRCLDYYASDNSLRMSDCKASSSNSSQRWFFSAADSNSHRTIYSAASPTLCLGLTSGSVNLYNAGSFGSAYDHYFRWKYDFGNKTISSKDYSYACLIAPATNTNVRDVAVCGNNPLQQFTLTKQ